MTRSVTVEAPAKVNLVLRILARESSGYHGLETVFCAISLSDTVTISPGDSGIELSVGGGIDTGPLERNLVVRAVKRFYEELGIHPSVRIELRKRIPSGAGLGGGSSDAAATLLALNHLQERPMTRDSLLSIGGELGSDVPFFLTGTPLAMAWSRGERLLSLRPLPSRPVLVSHPGVSVPTSEAYARLAEVRGAEYRPRPCLIDLDSLGDWDRLAPLARNDFQPIAAERIPMISSALAVLQRAGAEIALLAGSGACVFGVFAADADLAAPEEKLRDLGFSIWRARTLESMPTPRSAEG